MITQSRYIRYFLKRFHMTDCKETPFPFLSSIRLEDTGSTQLVDSTLYKYLIGDLLYLTHSRKYLSYDVSVVSKYMQDLHELHWKETNHILHYVQGTREFGIHYSMSAKIDLIDFTNSNQAGDSTDRKYTSGFVYMQFDYMGF